MTTNLISINEANGYLNLEYMASDTRGSKHQNARTPHVDPETEFSKPLKDDRQGRPNMEL